MGALYFGVGKALGSLAGGFAIESIGARNTFRCFSAGALLAASLYHLYNVLDQKHRQQHQQKDHQQDQEDKLQKQQEVLS